MLKNKQFFLIALGISLIFIAICLKVLPRQFHDYGGDAAQYIMLGESIAAGKGYAAYNYPGDPFCPTYPPLFPAMLAVVLYFFGRNFFLLHLLVLSCGCLALAVIYRLLRKYLSAGESLVVSCLSAFCALFLFYSTQRLLSEVPYMLFSFLAILALYAYSNNKGWINRQGLLLCFALVAAYFCRFIGGILFLASAAYLFLNRRFAKGFFVTGVFLTLAAAWYFYSIGQGHPVLGGQVQGYLLVDNYDPSLGSIIQHPSHILLRFIDGSNYYFEVISRILYPLPAPAALALLLPVISGVLILYGIWRAYSLNKGGVFHLYFLLSLLFLIMANHRIYGEGPRYFLPLVPIAFFYLYYALDGVQALFPKKNIIRPAVFAVLILLQVPNILGMLQELPYVEQTLPGPFKNYRMLHEWIQQNLKGQEVILSRKPTITSFLTGHKSLVYDFVRDPQTIWRQAGDNRVKYIVADEFSRETEIYLRPFIGAYAGKIVLIKKVGDTELYQVEY